MGIYKTEMYSDDFNRNVIVKSDLATGKNSLVGSVIIKTPEGNVPVEFPFPDVEPSYSVESGFEVFDKVLGDYIAARQQEQAEAEGSPAEVETPVDVESTPETAEPTAG